MAMVGDHVTIEVTEVTDHYGDTIVRGRYDGSYDKTNLPDEIILTGLLHRPRRQDRQRDHHPLHPSQLLTSTPAAVSR